MPKVDQLAKLLEAVASQNWTTARAIGDQIADAEEEKGHHSAAQLLRGALQPNGHRSRAPSQSNGAWLGDPGLLAAALTPLTGSPRLTDVALRPSHRDALATIVSEWTHREVLAARGVDRRRKLLFHGPPGCGKSLTAHALGVQLALPTFVVRIDAVIGAYLGQTALRIRELFRFAESQACVLLLDEIDALGKRRGNQLDVGELDRVVISLMQELEHAVPKGIVIATSNLPRQLDEALFRRFDEVFAFPRPTRVELSRFAVTRRKDGGLASATTTKRLLAGAASYADVVRRIDAEKRAIVLKEIAKRA